MHARRAFDQSQSAVRTVVCTIGAVVATRTPGVHTGAMSDTAPRTRRPRTEVDTREYECSHMRAPRGRGGWLFRNATTGEVVNRNGTYSEARRALAGGRWVVLP